MPAQLPSDLTTYKAWRFDSVLAGTFRRNKADFAHHDYPILAPLPHAGRQTQPIEASVHGGPYVYFVVDDAGWVRYVGKSLEGQVIHRWVRPGVGGPAKHYWTHSTRSGGAVFEIARGLQGGESAHYDLRYFGVPGLSQRHREQYGITAAHLAAQAAALAETALIRALSPDWNVR